MTVDLDARSPRAPSRPSQVIGQIVRQQVAKGAQITADDPQRRHQPGQITNIDCPVTLRCMAVQVDQVSGVGTVIKTGDYVDMVVGLTADKFPVITVSPGRQRDHRRRRPQQHQRQAPAPGPAGHGHAPPAAAGRDRRRDPGAGPVRQRRPGARRAPARTSTASRRSSSWRSPPSRPKSSSSPRWTATSPSPSARPATSSTRSPAPPAPGLGRDDRRHPQGPRRLVRCPAAGGRPDRDPDRHQEP